MEVSAIVLAPGEHRVVFASGKNRRPSEGDYTPAFALTARANRCAVALPDGETVVSQVTDFAAQWPDIAYGIPRTSQGPGQIDSAEFDYLVNPTPGELNALPQPAFGPQITHVEHFPQRLEVGQALRVTARMRSAASFRGFCLHPGTTDVRRRADITHGRRWHGADCAG